MSIQVKFFTLNVNQNVRICLKRILSKSKVSTPSRFQDIEVQNLAFSIHVIVAIFSVLWEKINLGKAGLRLSKSS